MEARQIQVHYQPEIRSLQLYVNAEPGVLRQEHVAAIESGIRGRFEPDIVVYLITSNDEILISEEASK